MKQILEELAQAYELNYTDSPVFWKAIDDLDNKQLKFWLDKLINTKTYRTADWFNVCSIINTTDCEKWTAKQKRYCVMELLQHWHSIFVYDELL